MKKLVSSHTGQHAQMVIEVQILTVVTAIPPPAPKAVTVEAEDDMPEINESTVDSLSQEVRLRYMVPRRMMLM